ncbi:MAG TPA: hypothetical protein VHT50_28125 [Mycobacterium sp.]|nr:hypothetical protein [Mycobacterium sp.]
MSAYPARAVATWLWQSTEDITRIVAFAIACGLREVYLATPLDGVDDRTAALAGTLRANGIAVSCLGGDPTWTLDHDVAVNWAFRAATDAVFDGVHLDVEPWALPRWPHDADALMASYATLVEEVAEVAQLAVDLVPWVVNAHCDVISRVVRQCDSATVLAYRNTAADILGAAREMLQLCGTHERRCRIGVETQLPSSSIPGNTTFGDDGEAVMSRELADVARRLELPLFGGFAVHHLDSWRTMRS